MIQKDLKTRLATTLRDVDIPARQEHLELTKTLVKNVQHRFFGRKRIGFARFLSLQIRFIGWKIWAMQGALLVAISIFFAVTMGKYYIDNPRYAALLLCCLSVLVLMTVMPFIHRSIQYKMHEIEAATRFSSVKLLIAKLLIVGIGDVLMLVCILCFAVLKTPLSPGCAALYLLFPFLLAGSGLLFLLNRIPIAKFVMCGLGFCLCLVAAFSLIAGFFPSFYQQTFSAAWAAVCLILGCICVIQFRQILDRGAYAEMQLV